jgi:membrane dipeptidase
MKHGVAKSLTRSGGASLVTLTLNKRLNSLLRYQLIPDVKVHLDYPTRLTMKRRSFLAGSLIAALPSLNSAQGFIPIADAHNHFGLLRRNTESVPLLGQLMKDSGVCLTSWAVVPDGPFLGIVSGGLGQVRTVNKGDLRASFDRQLGAALRGLRVNGVKVIKSVEDVEQAATGTPYVCLTSEGADFLEGTLDSLGKAYDDGIRHVQLVHYIKNAVGDLQTERPDHGGLTAFGKELVGALNQKGILVDLAHSTTAAIDHALAVSKVPIIWSHSYIADASSNWNAAGYRSRALGLKDAKKIADSGGAVGLWSLGPSFGRGIDGYAAEIMRMINLIGADHVMFGSDQDGLPEGAVINQVSDLRKVVEALSKSGVGEKVIRAVAFENYARCLKAAMQGRSV